MWSELYTAVGGRKALAGLCRVNESTVWRWENGHRRPSRATRDMVNTLCREAGITEVFT